MKKFYFRKMRGYLILSRIFFLCCNMTVAQTPCEAVGFLNFNEIKTNKPSQSFSCIIKKRTSANAQMVRGIENYRITKIKPGKITTQVKNEIWGLRCGKDYYINSYVYSKIEGYNKFLMLGYSSCFTGEPSIELRTQLDAEHRLPGRPLLIPNTYEVAYLLFESGEIKVLTRELVLELIKDNEKLNQKAKEDNIVFLQIFDTKDFYLVLQYLDKFNEWKDNFR